MVELNQGGKSNSWAQRKNVIGGEVVLMKAREKLSWRRGVGCAASLRSRSLGQA